MDAPPPEVIKLPIGSITENSIKELSLLNPLVSVSKVSPTQISLTSGRLIEFFSILNIDFEILSELNADLRLELILGKLFVAPPMGSIVGNLNTEISRQLMTWAFPVGAVDQIGYVGSTETEFTLPWLIGEKFMYLRPDQSWMSQARFDAAPLANRHKRFHGVPHYVNETVSLHDLLSLQRKKCGLWVYSGVEVVSLVDLFRANTYLYASTNSGLLPAPGIAGAIVHPDYPEITEQIFPWPALPPLSPASRQYGPALAVPIPVGCLMVATGGQFVLNHARFLL